MTNRKKAVTGWTVELEGLEGRQLLSGGRGFSGLRPDVAVTPVARRFAPSNHS